MDRLSEIEAFVSVVDSGGFTDAAKKLGVSKSAISKSVASLESRLAVRLLNRTTRRVSPTDVGMAYYDRARSVLRDVGDADLMVAAMQGSPQGSLRISAPTSFGVGQLSHAVAGFLCRYPDVTVEMDLNDRFVELISEGFDVAIRIGSLEDSSLKARKVAEMRQTMVASPAYLERAGTPASIEDLGEHELLHYSQSSQGNFWRLRSTSGEERHVRVGGRLTVNNGESLMKAAEAGLGIALVPSFILASRCNCGSLVKVLPGTEPALVGIYVIFPPGPFPQPKLRAFVDYMVEYFRDTDPDDWPGDR